MTNLEDYFNNDILNIIKEYADDIKRTQIENKKILLNELEIDIENYNYCWDEYLTGCENYSKHYFLHY